METPEENKNEIKRLNAELAILRNYSLAAKELDRLRTENALLRNVARAAEGYDTTAVEYEPWQTRMKNALTAIETKVKIT